MSDNFTTRTIYRLIDFLLFLLVTEDPVANRMLSAIEETEKVLRKHRQILKAIGDKVNADEAFKTEFLLLAVKVEIKHKAKVKVKLPPLRRVWPPKEKQES